MSEAMTEAREQAEVWCLTIAVKKCAVDPDDWRAFTAALDALEAQAKADALRPSAELAAEQAEDEGLWFLARTAPEGYLQQELRKLAARIEYAHVTAEAELAAALKRRERM